MTQANNPATTPMRLDGLQVGRAVAALTVVIGHAVDHVLHGQVGPEWQLGARYGVTLFFIISGFIMAQTTGTGSFSATGFLSRRIRRVVPIYWFVTLLVAALAILAPSMFKSTVFDIRHLLTSLFFIPFYDPIDPTSISPMFRLGWTLNYEMFFYVAFAATFALRLTTRAVVLTLLFGTLIVIGQFHSFDAAIPQFYTRIDTLGFVAGVWLGVLNLRNRLSADPRVAAALFVGSTIALGYIGFHYSALRNVPMTQVWLVIVCAAHVALLLIMVDYRQNRISAPLLYIGDASYSIYLFHMFAIGAASAVAHRLPASFLPPIIVLSAISGIVAGLIAYRFIERPLNRVMRGRRPLTAAQIDGAATTPPVADSVTGPR